MPWNQISVTTDEATAPQLADSFSELGAISVTYMDAQDEPVYEPGIGETKIWSSTTVIALYELDYDVEDIKNQVAATFHAQILQNWHIETIADQPWERAWMEHYQPMKFANKLWVCPTGQEQLEKNTVCLTLDPGLAFGTGTHPTTALCLEWLASHDLSDKIVIDYGCGSGILAIAALLLNAKTVFAVDIDPQAITATMVNAEKNKVTERIVCCLPEQFDKLNITAHVVLANILAKPLVEMVEQISSLVLPHGQLVLSGILAEQAEMVVNAYLPHLTLSELSQKDDWIRLVGCK